MPKITILHEEGSSIRWDKTFVDKQGRLYFPKSFEGGEAYNYLLALQEDKDYHIIIDNFGGSAYDCLSIINRLEELQSMGYSITTESYGYAFSGGTFLFVQGDRRIAHTGAAFMIHGAGGNSYGERISLRSYEHGIPTEWEPAFVDSLIILDEAFKNRFREIGWSERQIKDWFYTDDYNFMSSEEAYELDLATEIY
jgi:hypothetical protein